MDFPLRVEATLKLCRRRDQAAFCAGMSVTSKPLPNVTPGTILGNWFSPFSQCHVFATAMTRLNTMSRGGVLRQRVLDACSPVPDRGLHAVARVARAQMIPVLGGEVEGQQRVTVVD